VVLTLAGAAVVTGDLLKSAGYFGSSRVDPTKTVPVTQPEIQFDTFQQVRWMHEHTVGVFIEGEGFGFGRMPTNLGAIITAPQTQSDNNDVAWGPDVREAGKGKVHHGVERPTYAYGRGGLRTEGGSEFWEVRKVYLIGLVKHQAPVVYLTDQIPNMKDAKNVPTREPDAFEKTALERIKDGENVAVEQTENTMRVLGPIYAGKTCVKCHEQKGQLLGAFTYQLVLVPVEAGRAP
jgi:hypothetical protein